MCFFWNFCYVNGSLDEHFWWSDTLNKAWLLLLLYHEKLLRIKPPQDKELSISEQLNFGTNSTLPFILAEIDLKGPQELPEENLMLNSLETS